MSNLIDTPSHSNTSKPHSAVWSPWLTVFWGFCVLFVLLLAQEFTSTTLINQHGLAVEHARITEEVTAAAASTDGAMEGLRATMKEGEKLTAFIAEHDFFWPMGMIGSLACILAILLIVSAKRGLSIRDYLNLRNVSLQVWVIWIGIMIGTIVLLEIAASNVESLQSPFMEQIVKGNSNPVMLFLSVAVLVPIFEEFLFRGLLFKGLERSRLGGHGAVWVIAIFFAVIHMQYSLEIMLVIVPMAALLGYARMYSGSLLVPIVLHGINNGLALVMTMAQVHEGAQF